jgi:hypothetical protein
VPLSVYTQSMFRISGGRLKIDYCWAFFSPLMMISVDDGKTRVFVLLHGDLFALWSDAEETVIEPLNHVLPAVWLSDSCT